MKVIISGGGSGGHIFPAVAIADKIKERIPGAEILFVGASGKMEMEKVPKAGYSIKGLPIRGLQRKLTLKNLSFPFRLIASLIKAARIIKDFKPDIAIGVGGYASGAVLRVAAFTGIKTLVQEQNGYPGLTNKLLANKVDKICVAYSGMDKYFPKEKIVLTGNPVRNGMENLTDSKEEARKHFGLSPEKKTVLLFGGSLGARSLNEAMGDNTEILDSRSDVQWLWQCGKLYIEKFKNTETANLRHVHITKFIDRMDLAYKAADLAVTRAGALSISELSLVGQAAILIPSPNVAEDHQTKNAKALVESDAAVLIEDKYATDKMVQASYDLLDNTQKLDTLSVNVKKLAQPRAADVIVDEIIKLCE